MTDLRDRVPAHALVEKVVSLVGTPDLKQLPLGIVKPSADALAWLRGVRGEQEAARRLAKLGDGWVVVHSVPVGAKESDIDHLIVGPGGVFTINSKRHRDKSVWVDGGTFMVNGSRQPHIRNSVYEAARVQKALAECGVSGSVVPVIAVSGAKSISVKEPAERDGTRVEVVAMSGLTRLLTRRVTLSAEEVSRIADVLIRPETWSLRAPSAVPLAELEQEFARIDRGTDRWRLLIGGVVFVVTAAVAGIAWLLASGRIFGL